MPWDRSSSDSTFFVFLFFSKNQFCWVENTRKKKKKLSKSEEHQKNKKKTGAPLHRAFRQIRLRKRALDRSDHSTLTKQRDDRQGHADYIGTMDSSALQGMRCGSSREIYSLRRVDYHPFLGFAPPPRLSEPVSWRRKPSEFKFSRRFTSQVISLGPDRVRMTRSVP